MSKTKKTKQKKESIKTKISFLETLPNSYKNVIAGVIIVLPLLFYFGGWMLDGLQPVGNDLFGSIAQKHRWVEWRNDNGETVLWNPSVFGGEPIYSRITPRILHVDTALGFVSKVSYWAFIYLFLGGLGLCYLLRYKKIPWYAAIIVAVVLGLLRVTVKPLLIFFTLPATIVTLGLFLLVINAVIILLADYFVDGFAVSGFWIALLFSLLLSLFQSFLYSFLNEKKGCPS